MYWFAVATHLCWWPGAHRPGGVYPNAGRCGRLVWKVNSSLSTWRWRFSWSLALALRSSRNLASSPVLPATGVGIKSSAIAAKCCMAWGKFRKLLPVLITRHLLPKVHRRCTRAASIRLCSTVAKHGDGIPLTCCGAAASWSMRSVAPKTEMKCLGLHYSWNLALIILQQSFAVGGSELVWTCTAYHVLSVTDLTFPAAESEEGLERRGPNVWRCGLSGIDH